MTSWFKKIAEGEEQVLAPETIPQNTENVPEKIPVNPPPTITPSQKNIIEPKIQLSIEATTQDTISYKIEIVPKVWDDFNYSTVGGWYTTIAFRINTEFLEPQLKKIRLHPDSRKDKQLKRSVKAIKLENWISVTVPPALHILFETFVEQLINADTSVLQAKKDHGPEFLDFVNLSQNVSTQEIESSEIQSEKFDVQFKDVHNIYKNYDLQIDLRQFKNHPNGQTLRYEFMRIAQNVFYQHGSKPESINSPQLVASKKIADLQTRDIPIESPSPPSINIGKEQQDIAAMKRAYKRRQRFNKEVRLSHSSIIGEQMYLKGGLNSYARMSTMLYYHPLFSNLSFREATKSQTKTLVHNSVCVNGFLDGFVSHNYKIDPSLLTREERDRDILRKHTALKRDPVTGLRQMETDEFLSEVSKYRITKGNKQHEISNPQKDGIQWYYSEQSAINGDETGAGKSVQYIVAADMRTKPEARESIEKTFGYSSGRILIITIANALQQTINNIKEILGPNADISTDPSANAKWTVMSYSLFSGNHPNVKHRINAIKLQNFDVLVLDEAHSVKTPQSDRSRNIASFVDEIPFKWLASASISANKPIDLWFPLYLIGHPLGRLSKRQFSRLYTNTILSGDEDTDSPDSDSYSYDIVNINNVIKNVQQSIPGFDAMNLQDKINAANEYADKYIKLLAYSQVENVLNLKTNLVLTNVYKRKTKQEIWLDDALSEAEETAKEQGIPFDRDKYLNEHKEEIESEFPKHIDKPEFVSPENIGGRSTLQEIDQEVMNSQELAKETKYRNLLAIKKVPITFNLAAPIIQSGKKVIFFTCYQASGRLLQEKTNELLQTINPSFRCGYYMSDAQDTRASELESFKQPDSQIRAMVIGVEAGGTGIDLPNIVNDVFLNDFPWTPKDLDQLRGRAFRKSSESDVTTHYTIIENTPDKLYYQALQRKLRIAEMVQDVDYRYAEKVKNFQDTREELQQARDIYWNEILQQLSDTIKTNEFLKHGFVQAFQITSNWLSKLAYVDISKTFIYDFVPLQLISSK